VLGVTVSGGKVQYSKNGTVFYESSAEVRYPLAVDAVIYDTNAAVNDAMIVTSGAGGQTAAAAAAPTPAASAPRAATAASRSTAQQIGRAAQQRRAQIRGGF
jgi:hypothetical protein